MPSVLPDAFMLHWRCFRNDIIMGLNSSGDWKRVAEPFPIQVRSSSLTWANTGWTSLASEMNYGSSFQSLPNAYAIAPQHKILLYWCCKDTHSRNCPFRDSVKANWSFGVHKICRCVLHTCPLPVTCTKVTCTALGYGKSLVMTFLRDMMKSGRLW